MGDPKGAREMAEAVPDDASARRDPDFLWMLASTDFMAGDYAAAEGPLLSLFRLRRVSDNQKAAAAYGLCGVYRKLGRTTEQLRYALWLHTMQRVKGVYEIDTGLADFTVYWAVSGWDLGLLLDAEAPDDVLRSFVAQNPNMPDMRLVKYALAVRLARENRYAESAQIYDDIRAQRRAPRMRTLAALYNESLKSPQAKYRFAEFIAANENGIYFNDSLWGGLQNYVLRGSEDERLTGAEREQQIAVERKLRDDQEEYWRAYQILRDIVRDSGDNELGREAAQLAIRCLRRISERFGRVDELHDADRELSRWLRSQH
jgi:hypothetical protein